MQEILGPLEIRRRLILEQKGSREKFVDLLGLLLEGSRETGAVEITRRKIHEYFRTRARSIGLIGIDRLRNRHRDFKELPASHGVLGKRA